jgi:hypothetical protein
VTKRKKELKKEECKGREKKLRRPKDAAAGRHHHSHYSRHPKELGKSALCVIL